MTATKTSANTIVKYRQGHSFLSISETKGFEIQTRKIRSPPKRALIWKESVPEEIVRAGLTAYKSCGYVPRLGKLFKAK